ncbi:MAG TPA: hypothetical protein VFW06_10150 [Acidimicrobiia bacterium]|nr:hypothetical protein [Acidimicrobiia bacterium]
MPARPKRSNRDPKDDARAREWAATTRREGEAGELVDDSDFMARKLAEEKRRLNRA